jgi:hypothetical protein
MDDFTISAIAVDDSTISAIAVYAEGLIEGEIAKRALACELMQFLAVRVAAPLAVPSSKLDALWHNVLLDTALCEQIYDVLNNGKVIHHSPQDERMISEHDKMLRRLFTMAAMHLWESEPHTDFWTEEGTAMSDIKYCEIDDMIVYVTDSTIYADIARIVDMLHSTAPNAGVLRLSV